MIDELEWIKIRMFASLQNGSNISIKQLFFHKVCYLVLNGFTKEVIELHFNNDVWFCFGDQLFCRRCIVLTSLKSKIDKNRQV